MAIVLEIPGKPVPKARPRPSMHGGWYVPSAKAQEAVATHALKYKGLYAEGPVVVVARFHINSRSRADADNLMKLLLDGLQDSGAIGNDMRVVEQRSKKIWVATGTEKTIVWIGRPEEDPPNDDWLTE